MAIVDWQFDLVGRLGLLWTIAGAFTALAVVASSWLIYKHMRHYTQPHLQRYIVRILLMVPIYAVDSFLSFRFISWSLYFDVVRDCYEAYVIYNFFTLLLAFINTFDYEREIFEEEIRHGGGGEGGIGEGDEWEDWDEWIARRHEQSTLESVAVSEATVVQLLEEKPLASHPFPTCFLPQFQPNKAFLTTAKRCVFQFIVIKPLLAILSIGLEIYGVYGDGEWDLRKGYIYIVAVDNISVTVAMYFLVLFYHVLKEELQPFNPLPKFLCIKAVILFAFWQGIIISVLSYFGILHGDLDLGWTTRDVTVGLQDFLICIEMFFISLAHAYTFGYKTFRNKEPSCEDSIPCYACLCCCCCCCTITKNFSDVVSPGDVLHDGVETFAIKEMPSNLKKAGSKSASQVGNWAAATVSATMTRIRGPDSSDSLEMDVMPLSPLPETMVEDTD